MLRFWFGLLLSFREPFSTTNLNLGSLGVHFGDLGLHFGVFLEALTARGAQLGHFGGSVKKGVRFSAEYSFLLDSFWNSFPLKLTSTCKKWHPESS